MKDIFAVAIENVRPLKLNNLYTKLVIPKIKGESLTNRSLNLIELRLWNYGMKFLMKENKIYVYCDI